MKNLMQKILQYIFSIKNKQLYKILHLFGIKFKRNYARYNCLKPIGVFDFSYSGFNHFRERLARYGSYTTNIGDNIQSHAVKSLINGFGLKCTPVDRDTLTTYNGKIINVFMNGVVYYLDFSRHYSPVFLGICMEENRIRENAEILKNYGKIGCRDVSTAQRLKAYGADTFVTGCFSMTLPTRTEVPKTRKIFFVGVSGELKSYIPKELLPYSEFIVQRDISYEYPLSTEEIGRKNKLAIDMLDRYKNEATLIVTSLLHCASPCIAMGIPVILARDEYDPRFSSINKITKLYLKDDYKNINWFPDPVDVDEIKSNMIELAKSRLLHNTLPNNLLDYFNNLYPQEVISTKVSLDKIRSVEIEIFSYCNRNCWFCPNNFIDRHSDNILMDEGIYLNILNDFKTINYRGRISYSRYNEPLSHKDIFLKRLKQANELLPSALLHTK